MARKRLAFPKGVLNCVNATRTRGTILVSGDSSACNGMTIGWITVGHIWGKPVCVVMVRPSRHTFKFTEASDSFTVNVLSKKHQKAVNLFGEESGRDMDKFAATGLHTAKSLKVKSPCVREADLVIECRIAYKQPMDPSLVSAKFVRDCYESGDYHTMYCGEIVAIHAK